MTARSPQVSASAIRYAYPLSVLPGAQKRRQLANQNSSQDRVHRVTEASHRIGIGTGAVDAASGRVSAGGLDVHVECISSMDQTYRGALELNMTGKCRVVHNNPDDIAIAETISAALSNKCRKVIARSAKSCLRTVNEWCLGRRLPNAAALIRLMAADDEVYRAVIHLTGRSSDGDLTAEQRGALVGILEALGVK